MERLIEMKLMDRRVEHIIIEVTPEMMQRVQELNQAAIKDMKKISDIAKQSMEMQNASMLAAKDLSF